MTRTIWILIAFIQFINSPSFAADITIKRGDTLTKISKEYNISIQEIMNLNKITDPNNLKVGQDLLLPEKSKKYNFHTVLRGENLNTISQLYNIKKNDIVSLNSISNPNYLIVGQVLFLPDNFKNKASKDENDLLTSSNKSSLPKKNNSILKSNESVTSNSISNNWKSYGPIKINWSNWKYQDGSYVSSALNKNGQPLFIAIKCPDQKINRTGANGNWRNWMAPRDDFEYKLLKEFCKN